MAIFFSSHFKAENCIAAGYFWLKPARNHASRDQENRSGIRQVNRAIECAPKPILRFTSRRREPHPSVSTCSRR